jgi:putative ABC transport system permease protein
VSELFNGQDPVGDNVAVNCTNYQIIGVTASKGSNGTSNQDDVAFAPLTAAQDTLTGDGGIGQIVVEARSSHQLTAAQIEATGILDQLDPVSPGSTATSNFSVINQGSILQTAASSSKVFTTLLGEVAAISFLVGGIGVMSIMLVSVTERTREIGIRKAVGARRRDILVQFLVEAVLVSLMGRTAGVLGGVNGLEFVSNAGRTAAANVKPRASGRHYDPMYEGKPGRWYSGWQLLADSGGGLLSRQAETGHPNHTVMSDG